MLVIEVIRILRISKIKISDLFFLQHFHKAFSFIVKSIDKAVAGCRFQNKRLLETLNHRWNGRDRNVLVLFFIKRTYRSALFLLIFCHGNIVLADKDVFQAYHVDDAVMIEPSDRIKRALSTYRGSRLLYCIAKLGAAVCSDLRSGVVVSEPKITTALEGHEMPWVIHCFTQHFKGKTTYQCFKDN